MASEKMHSKAYLESKEKSELIKERGKYILDNCFCYGAHGLCKTYIPHDPKIAPIRGSPSEEIIALTLGYYRGERAASKTKESSPCDLSKLFEDPTRVCKSCDWGDHQDYFCKDCDNCEQCCQKNMCTSPSNLMTCKDDAHKGRLYCMGCDGCEKCCDCHDEDDGQDNGYMDELDYCPEWVEKGNGWDSDDPGGYGYYS